MLAQKIIAYFGEDLTGLHFGIWGLSFKPGTDDMREASSLVLIKEIVERGGKVQAYDPAAMPVEQRLLPAAWLTEQQVVFAEHQFDALKGADALVLVTEWKPFCYPDIAAMRKVMRQYVVFDGRNQYDPEHMIDAGFKYYGIGRGRDVKSELKQVEMAVV